MNSSVGIKCVHVVCLWCCCVVDFVPQFSHVSFLVQGSHITNFKKKKKKKHCIQTPLFLDIWLLRVKRNQELTKGEIRVWIILNVKACGGLEKCDVNSR